MVDGNYRMWPMEVNGVVIVVVVVVSLRNQE